MTSQDRDVRAWYEAQHLDDAALSRILDLPDPAARSSWRVAAARSVLAAAAGFALSTVLIATALHPPPARAEMWDADIVRLALAHPDGPHAMELGATLVEIGSDIRPGPGEEVDVMYTPTDGSIPAWALVRGLKVVDLHATELRGAWLVTTAAQDGLLQQAMNTGAVQLVPAG